MRIYLAYMLLLIGTGGDGIISQAIQAYDQEDFKNGITLFGDAMDRYPDKQVQLNYNIAQCYLQLDVKDSATYHFQMVLSSREPAIASRAANNIGVIQADALQLNFALNSFKEALILDPSNESARYNFELVRRQKQNQPPPDKNDPPPPETNQPPPPPPPMNDRELEKLLSQIRKRKNQIRRNNDLPLLMTDTLSEEEAFAVLEALRNQNPQFVQQLRKVVRTSSLKKKNKRPDW